MESFLSVRKKTHYLSVLNFKLLGYNLKAALKNTVSIKTKEQFSALRVLWQTTPGTDVAAKPGDQSPGTFEF